MGYFCHHAIVVMCSDFDRCQRVRDEIETLAAGRVPVTPVVRGAFNGYGSFCVLPDDSKEGWEPSDAGDAARDAIVRLLDEYRYEDGSSPFKWAVVQFGDEAGDNRIIAHEDERRRRKPGKLP